MGERFKTSQGTHRLKLKITCYYKIYDFTVVYGM